jgi:protein gp37
MPWGLHWTEKTGQVSGLSWCIVGGESGPGFRPMDEQWVRDLRDQCQAAGVSFFYKQPAGLRPGGSALLDGREWRNFPEAPA